MNRDGKRKPENGLAAAEMSVEANCNQIDGIINNEAPRPSLLESLRQQQEQREEYERQKEMAQEQTRGTPHRKGR